MTFTVEIANPRGAILWRRVRHTCPAAIDAAVAGNWELHDTLSTRDSIAAWKDKELTENWQPRKAPLTIARLGYVLRCFSSQ